MDATTRTALSQEQCKEWVHKLSKYSKGQTEVKQSIPKPIPIVDSDKEGGEHTVEVKSAKNIFESTSTTEITTASSKPVSSILSTRQYGGVHTVEVRSARNIFESQSTKKEITTSNTPVYSSTFTEENKSAKTVGVKSPSPIAQASPNIKKFHTNPVIDVSISKPEEEIEHIVEVKLVRNIFETLSTHKKPTPPPRPVSSIIPRISPESKRITSDTSRPRSTIEDARSHLHHVNTSNRGYNHPGSETSYSEQKNLKGSEELKLEDARINLKHVSILKEDNKENNKATQSKEETSEISSDKINDTIGISGDFNIAENSTQSSNDLKEIEEVGVLEIDNSKKVKMSEREKNGDTVCNNRSDRPDSGYSTTVGENGRNSKENESDETNRSLSANVSEIVNQKTNTADIISRIPDPDEQSVGKMELNQEQDEATLLVHKSNGSVNVSCSDVVTLNKQSDETSENVLENINQETNTADIISRIPDPDEQSVGKMELNQEQDEATLLVHKSNGSVNVSCSDVVTLNKQSDETSENVLENVNQETNTADIISRIPDPDEQSVGKMELNQEQDEATLLVHKSNGSVNVSCSDVVTLNKQSDETSENVLENVNQETNTADIISRIPDPDEQSVGKMELNQEQDEATLLVHKSNGSINVSCSDVVTLNKQSDETSENVLENVNQETNTADIISRIPDPDEQSVGKMELNQEQDEATLLVHKSNGSINVSCSDVVTLNKQSDETSENVLENVNQETNTAEITSQTTEPGEQNGDTMKQEEEQNSSIVHLRKSNRKASVSLNDVFTLLPFVDQADTPGNYAPLTFPNTRRSQTPSSSCESENKDRTTLSSQNIPDKPKLDENENKAASTELVQKEAQHLSTSHHDNVDGVVKSVSPMHEVVENYLDIDSLFSKINFSNIPVLPNTIPRRADLISFHELKDTLDKLGSEDECSEVPSEDDECSEVPSEDDECSEVNSTSSDQIIQRLSRLVES